MGRKKDGRVSLDITDNNKPVGVFEGEVIETIIEFNGSPNLLKPKFDKKRLQLLQNKTNVQEEEPVDLGNGPVPVISTIWTLRFLVLSVPKRRTQIVLQNGGYRFILVPRR